MTGDRFGLKISLSLLRLLTDPAIYTPRQAEPAQGVLNLCALSVPDNPNPGHIRLQPCQPFSAFF